MKKYIKTYYDYFHLDICDTPPCEMCGHPAVNIHHIDNKGMGGSKKKDFIGNLAAVCMECHNKAHRHPEFNEELKKKHLINVENGDVRIWSFL